MADLGLLARTYHAIQTGFVRDGRAPHYTDLASTLGLPPEEARRAQRELLAALNGPLASLGGAHWAHPDTDYIVGFSPFSNLPTQYAIAVDGQQHWYGQCGLESLAVSWLFPGKEVRIETRCLDCAAPFSLRMHDGELLAADPDSVVGHSNVPLSRAAENWPYT
jgi:hypothetical protein